MSNQPAEFEPIPPDAAAAILKPRLVELEAEGWKILVETDYMARLTRGDQNLDVRVDLLGQLEMETKPLSLVQESGRLIAMMLFFVIFLLILTLVSGLGWLN